MHLTYFSIELMIFFSEYSMLTKIVILKNISWGQCLLTTMLWCDFTSNTGRERLQQEGQVLEVNEALKEE